MSRSRALPVTLRRLSPIVSPDSNPRSRNCTGSVVRYPSSVPTTGGYGIEVRGREPPVAFKMTLRTCGCSKRIVGGSV